MGFYDDLVKGMSDEELKAVVGRKVPYRRYKPIFRSTTSEKTIGEQYLEKVEEEGDVDEVTKKFLRKMLRQPGSEKDKAMAYLERTLRKAEEEGRI